MKVELLSYTPNCEEIVALAARLCYSADDISEIKRKMDGDRGVKLIEKLLDLGHESPFEHINFTFGISGVSRALTHQLVRHRIASYSQKSQRYVSEKNFEYIVPPKIKNNPQAYEIYRQLMVEIGEKYEKLVELGIANEDARYVLPNSCETKIVVTMNARSLFNFFKHRACVRAQWEIRALANEMLKLVKEKAPNVFKHAGANCQLLGFCPEGEMGCGKVPTLKEVMK
ncbi:thymidylate synthase (FAD) [Anaerobranca californiensis DSM 14826]|jgi:thymidylate synthase (FAD)|uniref:Flavin-dependent thymidylate synthase n=1 Tax=Anaerobranca californiensis DSM 14826 TaxID=1120989 RepID=A0A1M6QYE2_9FIRM|nr:FAD-dependent thymidylate synthase [Anaerobranca californiensis]SHK25234.1 thymidylate synthase (FAD) [Anaerobranca californiensis DSM 14826]